MLSIEIHIYCSSCSEVQRAICVPSNGIEILIRVRHTQVKVAPNKYKTDLSFLI